MRARHGPAFFQGTRHVSAPPDPPAGEIARDGCLAPTFSPRTKLRAWHPLPLRRGTPSACDTIQACGFPLPHASPWFRSAVCFVLRRGVRAGGRRRMYGRTGDPGLLRRGRWRSRVAVDRRWGHDRTRRSLHHGAGGFLSPSAADGRPDPDRGQPRGPRHRPDAGGNRCRLQQLPTRGRRPWRTDQRLQHVPEVPTLWSAARAKGLRVGSLLWPAGAGATGSDRADFGLGWPIDPPCRAR